MSEVSYVTPTMLSRKCLMQIRFFDIERWKLPPGIAKVLGRAFHHQTLEVDQRRRIDTGVYAPLDELKEGLVSQLQEGVKEVDPADPEVAEAGGSVAEAYQTNEKIGLALLDKYNENRDVLKGRAVEVKVEVPIADTTLRGYIDVDVSDTKFKDAKTKGSTRKTSQTAVDYDLQFSSYAYAKAKMTGQADQEVEGVYFYKSAKPSIQVVESYRGPAQHEELEARASALKKMIEADAFIPINKSGLDGWVCSERFCGAYTPRPDLGFPGCPFGARARVMVGGGK